jgi:lipopolysaccharide biosynthesis glycosyltransferase
MTTSAQRPALHIVSNADGNFLPGLEVAVASAVAAASGACDYHFLVLDGGLPADALRNLGKTIAKLAARRGIHATIDPLVINQSRLAVLPERRGSRMHYAKLLLPEILPHLDSIIYLDADVLCYAGLESIHAPAGEPHWLLAGALDFFDRIEKDCPWIDQLSDAERKLPYINSGVMWMNLKGLREMDFTNRAIAARASVGMARHADQAVFNFLCRGRAFVLPDKINHRTSIGATRPLCEGNLDLNIHYIGAPKPWLGPPKTSKWLAHRLWHQARSALFPHTGSEAETAPPHDLSSIRRKAMCYTIFNPGRAAHYRNDLRSLKDPGKVIAQGQERWRDLTGAPFP